MLEMLVAFILSACTPGEGVKEWLQHTLGVRQG